jgi:hypothetical protein
LLPTILKSCAEDDKSVKWWLQRGLGFWKSLEERIEAGEDAETCGYDFELELLVFPVIDFLLLMLDSCSSIEIFRS